METIRVGKLVWQRGVGQRMRNKNTLTFSMVLLAKAYNVELFLFSKDGVDFEAKTIYGAFYENGKWVYKTVPIPPLIDAVNHGMSSFVLKMEKYSRLVQPFRKPRKFKTYEVLEADGKHANWLIPTEKVANFEDVKKALDNYGGRTIVKHTNGSGGTSVFSVSLNNGGYDVHKGTDKKHFDEEGTSTYINEILSSERASYIAQAYINSKTCFDEPCDLRLHCRRGKDGEFFIDLIARIGAKDSIVSNWSSGGYIMECKEFLKREFGNEWKNEYDKLMAFGKEYSIYYQSLFPRRTTSVVGIDLGFQRENDEIKYYIFEINTYVLGFLQFRVSDSVNQLEYYRHLWDKHELSKIERGSK